MNPILLLRNLNDINLPGGADRVLWETVKRLHSNQKFLPIPVIISNRKKNLFYKDFEIKKQDGFDYYHITGKRFIDNYILNSLIKIVKEKNIQVIHCNDYKSNFMGLLIKSQIPNCKLITTVHGYIFNTFKSHFYNFTDKQILHFFNHIILVNEKMRTLFSKHLQKKIFVLYNGVDPNIWCKDITRDFKNDMITIGFVGRISPEKGWKEFLKIAEFFLLNYNNVDFSIAGDGPDFESMQNVIKLLPNNSRIHSSGQIEDMKKYYESIDILCAPSHTEGFPMVQLEANAMNIPVIATDVGGVRELIIDGYNGFLADKCDVEMLINKLKYLIENPGRIEELGNNGRMRIIEHFTIQKNINLLQDIYAETIK